MVLCFEPELCALAKLAYRWLTMWNYLYSFMNLNILSGFSIKLFQMSYYFANVCRVCSNAPSFKTHLSCLRFCTYWATFAFISVLPGNVYASCRAVPLVSSLYCVTSLPWNHSFYASDSRLMSIPGMQKFFSVILWLVLFLMRKFELVISLFPAYDGILALLTECSSWCSFS